MRRDLRPILRYLRTRWPTDHRSISPARPGPGVAFETEYFRTIDDFPADRFTDQYHYEQTLLNVLRGWPLGRLKLRGYCSACQLPTAFEFLLADDAAPNWRESLACNHCGLITRWRAAANLIRSVIGKDFRYTGYITERLSPLFDWLMAQKIPLVGSEYLGPEVRPGERRRRSGCEVMHQDVTNLAFDSSTLGAIFTFDVLEHVPDFRSALAEFLRVLVPEGKLVISVPFSVQEAETVVRATHDQHGNIEHLMEPEYHGDPMSAEGVLCYYNYGWDLLDHLREAGFEHVRLHPVWDPELGYLGLGQCFLIASAPRVK